MHVMNVYLLLRNAYYMSILTLSTTGNLCNPSYYNIGSIVGGTKLGQI